MEDTFDVEIDTAFIEKQAKAYLLFNKNNYSLYDYIYNLRNENIYFTGIPYFDNMINCTVEDTIIYIDHPYLEDKRHDWNLKHHKKIAINLAEFAKKRKQKVYVKLHPRSNKNIWNNYKLESKYFKIIQKEDPTSLYKKAKLFISFSSSLVPGFLSAKKNVVLIAWHPNTDKVLGLDFSAYDICHLSSNPEDIWTKHEEWTSNNLAIKSSSKYDLFLKKYNYPFDGNATQRIYDLIFKDSLYNRY